MKKTLSFLLLAFLAVVLASCSDGGKKRALRFTTGGEAGTYYAFGSVIAQHITNNAGVEVLGLVGKGSQGNIMALTDRTAELAFCQSDVMAYAYNGTNTFAQQGKVTDFSVLAALYTEQVQIITVNPGIKSVADLRGKVVSIGAAGSGVYFNAIDILKAYGMTEDDIKATYQSFGDSADALKDGKIDAAFIVAGAPTTAVTDLATTKDVSLISIDDEHADALIAMAPYYSKATIVKDTYKTAADVQTLAVGAVVIVRNDVSDDDVYAICADIFENAPNLGSIHAKYNEINLEYGASMTSVPYHPGAARYFSEKGYPVASSVTSK